MPFLSVTRAHKRLNFLPHFLLPRLRPLLLRRAKSACALFALSGFLLTCGALPAAAVSLSGDAYIKAPPYQPPPLITLPSAPLGGAGAASSMPPLPPGVNYQPRPSIDPGAAAQHELWCRQNHPSYRRADNSYRPFDRSDSMPPQARIPCVSP